MAGFLPRVGIEHIQNDPQFDQPDAQLPRMEMIEVLDGSSKKNTGRAGLRRVNAVRLLVTEVADPDAVTMSRGAGQRLSPELDHPTAGRVLVSGTPISYNGEVRTESPPAP